ncbi:MAG: Transcriptional regulator, AraC family, partial [uncultured Chloroflexia bacterium]
MDTKFGLTDPGVMKQQNELACLIDEHVMEDGVHPTVIPRVSLIRMSQPTEPLHALHEPALCIVAQGKKQVLLGDKVYLYNRDQYLIVSVDLPVIGQIIEAEPETPYLCFRLDLDAAMLGELMIEAGLAALTGQPPSSGLTLSPAAPELLDAVIRLLRLLATPRDVNILAPLAEREILYRLLTGDQAQKLRQIAHADSKLHRVNRAISWIKENYREPFRVETVASEARMSASALHQHFKVVTSMSPLQYQKQLRLQEARRLILGASLDAATAGFSVGYGSSSQFSREYSRFFGAPPLRDTIKLKALHMQQ